MSLPKEKVVLTQEEETLLIPLYAKAVGSRGPSPIFDDAKAQEILSRVEYDFARLNVPRKTAITLCLRAAKLDAYTNEFLAQNAGGLVIHLACGLDSRCVRVRHEGAEWVDLDLPKVIELRRKFYPEGPGYRLIASSVTDHAWMDSVPATGRRVLIVAEGLLMYLSETEVRALVLRLQECYPGCELVCDVFSELTARRIAAHPSLQKTGAVVQWGIDEARDIERWGQGIQLREEWFFSQSEAVSKLGLGYRLAFQLAGLFAAANKAHRIVRLVLAPAR
ncbi:MAG: class I SAM-dependent methyltransferase [Chloroflexi bacterium]|nr:class I SAM-dependent methyltransferase [Chloroflexota bacterium]